MLTKLIRRGTGDDVAYWTTKPVRSTGTMAGYWDEPTYPQPKRSVALQLRDGADGHVRHED